MNKKKEETLNFAKLTISRARQGPGGGHGHLHGPGHVAGLVQGPQGHVRVQGDVGPQVGCEIAGVRGCEEVPARRHRERSAGGGEREVVDQVA